MLDHLEPETLAATIGEVKHRLVGQMIDAVNELDRLREALLRAELWFDARSRDEAAWMALAPDDLPLTAAHDGRREAYEMAAKIVRSILDPEVSRQ